MNSREKGARIAIVDYGVCNLFSIYKACRIFSDAVILTEDARDLMSADAIVVPGVGSFESGMEGLRVRNLVEPIRQFAESGKPVLGICLGAQLLLSLGCEFGAFKGLNIVPGRVKRFPELKTDKIPQIGWNTIDIPARIKKESIFANVKKDSSFYFVHSYVLEPEFKEDIFAHTTYGGHVFCSILKRGNIYGCQFHPEKSGDAGLKVIAGFAKLASNHARTNSTKKSK